MAESSDYTPGQWAGHDFKSARKAYGDAVVGRSYSDAVSLGKTTDDVLPDVLICKATSSLTIITDVTGSMEEWPKTMFSKLPYLEHEVKEYLGDDAEIGFGAVGDANSDKYPVQARPYTNGLALKDEMEALIIERGGGGQQSESYELAALYYARNVTMEKAVNPVLIIIGDEGFYDVISPDQAKGSSKVMIPERITAKQVFEELMRKYSVYLIRKPYSSGYGDTRSSADTMIHNQWVSILGEDRIVNLPDPERVVDVIFGILAKETDRIEYFKEEIEDRQEKDKVNIVYKSLETVHANRKSVRALPKSAGKSTMRTKSNGNKTKSLI